MEQKIKYLVKVEDAESEKRAKEILEELKKIQEQGKSINREKEYGKSGRRIFPNLKKQDQRDKRYKEVELDYQKMRKFYELPISREEKQVEEKQVDSGWEGKIYNILSSFFPAKAAATGAVIKAVSPEGDYASKLRKGEKPWIGSDDMWNNDLKTLKMHDMEDDIEKIKNQIPKAIAAYGEQLDIYQERLSANLGERIQTMPEMMKESIEEYEKKDKDWEFSEDAKKYYEMYFNDRLAHYRGNAEEIKKIQTEMAEREKRVLEHSTQQQAKATQQKSKDTKALAKVEEESAAAREARFQRLEALQIKAEEDAAKQLERQQKVAEFQAELQNQEVQQLQAVQSATTELTGAQEILTKNNEKIAEQHKELAEAATKAAEKSKAYFMSIAESVDKLALKIQTPWLSTAVKSMGHAIGKFADKFQKSNDDNTKNAQKNAEEQRQAFEKVTQEIQDYSAIITDITTNLFAKMNEQLDGEIDAAKEKYSAITEKYDELVEKRKASDEEINSLEEQAKNAKGGRLLVIQSQIDQEMEKNKQLSDQEKELQKEKEKAQKEIEKKEKQKKKNELKNQLIGAIANTAAGVAKAFGQWGFPLGIINAALVAAAGAIEIATISKQISKLEDGGLLHGSRHSAGGMRILGSNIEVEGGEYVVNRQSTDKNLGLLGYINSQRRELNPTDLNTFFSKTSQGFESPFRQALAQGGQLPNMEPTFNLDNELLLQAIQNIRFEPKVSVTDINAVQSDMVRVDAWTGM